MSKNKEFMVNNNLPQTWSQCQNEGGERVEIVPLEDLRDYPEHPFRVIDDEAMAELTDSVRTYGVAVPAIVRSHPDGGFELVSGHRRKRACELAGLTHLPVIIRDLDDNAAAIVMADSNLQRDKLLPSERAYAYEMKLNAMKRQGFRSDLNSSQFGAVDKVPVPLFRAGKWQ